MSEDRINELASIKKLEVAEITLQKARAQASEIVYARWLDDAARRTSEDLAATQVNANDHEDEVQATPPTTASRIILSKTATKINAKEQRYSSSVGWRNMKAWYGERETNKCWRKIKNILMEESVVDVPTTFVSENHRYVGVLRGIDFLSSECGRTRANGTLQHKGHATHQTDEARWRD